MSTLVLFPPFLTCWVSIIFLELEYQSYVIALDLLIPAQLSIKVQILDSFV
jgi:hypothetical protein